MLINIYRVVIGLSSAIELGIWRPRLGRFDVTSLEEPAIFHGHQKTDVLVIRSQHDVNCNMPSVIF